MTTTSLESGVLDVIARCADLLPGGELREMSDLVKAGEPGIALENLSTQLYEHGASVQPEIVRAVEVLGRSMGLDSKYWHRLEQA